MVFFTSSVATSFTSSVVSFWVHSCVQLKIMFSSQIGRSIDVLVFSCSSPIEFFFVYVFIAPCPSILFPAILSSSNFVAVVVCRFSSRFRCVVISNCLQPVQSSPPIAKEPVFFPVGGKSCRLYSKVLRLLPFEALASSGPCLRRGIAHSSLSASCPIGK